MGSKGKAQVRAQQQWTPNEHAISYVHEPKLQKSSWTNEGVIQFNQLMEVVEDRNSPEGKKFDSDSDFQMEMAEMSGNRGKKRKASSEMAQPMNELSSEDENNEE